MKRFREFARREVPTGSQISARAIAQKRGLTPPISLKNLVTTTWNGESLGGVLNSGPGVCSWSAGRLDLFALGGDNSLYHKWFDGGWSGWESLGGFLTSDPAAVSWGNGRIDVFARGGDNAIYHKYFDGGWSNWESLGGVFKSGPSVCSWAAGRLDVFARGGDDSLYHKWFDGGWSGWESLGGSLTSDPAAVSWGHGRIDVFVRGTDNALHHKWHDRGWSHWESLGGGLTSGPDVCSWGVGRLDVFVRGTDNALHHKWHDRGWSNWEYLGGSPTSDPAAVSWSNGRIDLFVRGEENAIYHRWFDGAWRPLLPQPIEFSGQISSGGLAALGGWVKVSVNPDGSVRWQGNAHNSGADNYDFGVSAIIRPSSGPAIALAHTGSVGGTFSTKSRDHGWNETHPPTPLILSALSAYKDAKFEVNVEYDSGIGSALESLVSFILKFGVGTVLGPAIGAVIFVGVEVGSLIATGSLVPGARILNGVLWMAGPGNTLLAIAAEGVAIIGSRTRELTQEEYDWANTEVFFGALPPRDQIVLTDTIGGGNRAFTFPRYDGKITLNMGPDAFADPRLYHVGYTRNPERYPFPNPAIVKGEIFIHELVHACQIQHSSMDVTLLADAFASKVCETTGGNPYVYGLAGSAYTDFNLEQQAQIVSDWFAGAAPTNTDQTGIPKDTNSPYFRYINENVRIGNFG
jgi:Repeat of unknown function (DUF346)